MIKIIKNRIKCNHCGDIITSEHVHDFKWCKCGMVAVDGGKDYMKRTYKNSRADYEDLSIYEEVDDEELTKDSHHTNRTKDFTVSELDFEKIDRLIEKLQQYKNKGDLHDLYR